MHHIPHVKKKIGDTYLVWFKNSHNFTRLEEPAWFVFQNTLKGQETETIAKLLSSRYDLPFSESLDFVTEIRKMIGQMNNPETEEIQESYSAEINEFTFKPYSVHNYLIGDKLVTFSFQSYKFENYLHPLIAHFETKEKPQEAPLFELFAWSGKTIFRFNHKITESWGADESHLVKGRIFMYLLNVMYDRTDADWLMTVHASAITNGRKTILFSAAPGSGKTTIAALLQAKGFQLISDDFVPLVRETFCAYPFPIAMSVKPGSIDVLSSHYPTLEERPLNFINKEKSVRYLPLDLNSELASLIHPVRDFVVIQYDKSVDFAFEKLEPLDAVAYLLDQSWVSPSEENVAILFDRLLKTDFYKLTYSNTERALEAISNLFDHD